MMTHTKKTKLVKAENLISGQVECTIRLQKQIHRYRWYLVEVGLVGGPVLATYRLAYEFETLRSENIRPVSGNAPIHVSDAIEAAAREDWASELGA